METYLLKKLGTEVSYRKIHAMCCWTDLLGFGAMVSKQNWHPNSEEWLEIAKRLRVAQTLCVQSIGIGEYVFVSNDGFIRNLDLSREPGHMDYFGIWFRGLIWYHISINSVERELGFPGARTVVAAGEALLHNWSKFTHADLFFEFSGRDMGPGSSYADASKDIIMENPRPLQMNTAFSKSYIIDAGGSKQGVPGPNFYIEQTVLDLLVDYAKEYSDHCGEPIIKNNGEVILFAIPHAVDSHLYHLGFELEQPILFDHNGLRTNIYKVKKFYPWDEDPNECCFSLDDDRNYFLSLEMIQEHYGNPEKILDFPVGPKHMGYEINFIEVDDISKV